MLMALINSIVPQSEWRIVFTFARGIHNWDRCELLAITGLSRWVVPRMLTATSSGSHIRPWRVARSVAGNRPSDPGSVPLSESH